MCVWFLMHHFYAAASDAGPKERVLRAAST